MIRSDVIPWILLQCAPLVTIHGALVGKEKNCRTRRVSSIWGEETCVTGTARLDVRFCGEVLSQWNWTGPGTWGLWQAAFPINM
ncbi:hypothetical protein BDP55DRAFT_677393 [Colletotrichum godetiae]|uniref:Uncharacterized protein n=1 Tax=Colletotrichum godetiae TaxID=1209918 RepID=A0AAJ0ABJ0_9PEZI|nr:uncharacterized protein BDP55DRAFT_677393 [Colletotrichum godetiae]KAK1660125.1 hypothetical protein BDP55DRAFT_677393 [Colletotrichum godetiae]